MKKQQSARKLEQLWENGIEHANEEHVHNQAFDQAALDIVAGLRVQSGAKAGGWLPATYTQNMTCGCPS